MLPKAWAMLSATWSGLWFGIPSVGMLTASKHLLYVVHTSNTRHQYDTASLPKRTGSACPFASDNIKK